MSDKIEVLNVNVPGHRSRVDARKFSAMEHALRQSLPVGAPGLTQKEMFDAVKSHLPADLFPEGKTAGWWAKTVQLDQEARGNIVREKTKPLRWYWSGGNDTD